MKRPPGEAHRIWTAPIVIAVATLIGLVGALVADGIWDWLASLLLFGVLGYAGILGMRRHEAR